ncbi:hypothetical protein ACWNS2_11030 [Planococcus plakortidis]|uniref:hypothetical protein n=1 Tax=Planococcus plakortidis TaxID=1038856 RepID=UPI0012EDA871|nr:hypothetical protein [Planococcus plakortidis]
MNRQSYQMKQLKRMLDESYRKTNSAIVSELRKQGVNASLCKKPAILELTV